jgi:hypothetical protein
MREASKFNELGLLRLQGQTEFTQPLGERLLSAKSIRTKLETQHEVVYISHHAGLTTKSRLDHSLEPKIEHIVEIYITQPYADRTSLRGSLFAWMNLSVLQNANLRPAPD